MKRNSKKFVIKLLELHIEYSTHSLLYKFKLCYVELLEKRERGEGGEGRKLEMAIPCASRVWTKEEKF